MGDCKVAGGDGDCNDVNDDDDGADVQCPPVRCPAIVSKGYECKLYEYSVLVLSTNISSISPVHALWYVLSTGHLLPVRYLY